MDLQGFARAVSRVCTVALGHEVSVEPHDGGTFHPAALECLTAVDGVDLSEFISSGDRDAISDLALSVAGKDYVIRAGDAHADDPAVYSPYGDLISESAFTFVAVELALWLAGRAPAIHEHRRFNIYYGIREHFDTLVKDTYYSNKLWLVDTDETYVATVADLMIVLVGRSTSDLTSLLSVLGVEPNK